MGACAAFLAWSAVRVPPSNIVLEHHVAVYGRLANGDWAMSSDEEGRFAFRPCRSDHLDVDGMLEQGIGYVADHARWEERGTCKSIQDVGLGFYWRDANRKYTKLEGVTAQ